ncbi:MAG: UDP-N-acetylmuramoyl-L-alanyl-D-glutamate--2,6-diaminopimelate ligase [bacterium]
MTLKQLLKNLKQEVKGITCDSREVKKGYLFIAYKGVNQDGHKFIQEARKKGAKIIIGETKDCDVQVKDGREALALVAAKWFGNPGQKLKLIGITGTNGKTSTAQMLAKILNAAYVGTIGYEYKNIRFEARETTPDAITLHKILRKFLDAGAQYAVIEATSQGLAQKRLFGLNFEIGIFTNFTQDHLDYHKTFKKYLAAKQILFNQSKIAVLNQDDKASKKFRHKRIIWYGKANIKLKMPGEFNQYNAGAALSAAKALGIKKTDAIKNVTVPGRFEPIGRRVIVDYAHTPDALENLLKNARQIAKNKLICVFGCGGDRDKTKRPIMGKIATKICDYAIITSDNPRTENPKKIIKNIIAGVAKNANFEIIENRAQAIEKAIKISQKGDLVVIAGKGHEDYQILGTRKIHFDDREKANNILTRLGIR